MCEGNKGKNRMGKRKKGGNPPVESKHKHKNQAAKTLPLSYTDPLYQFEIHNPCVHAQVCDTYRTVVTLLKLFGQQFFISCYLSMNLVLKFCELCLPSHSSKKSPKCIHACSSFSLAIHPSSLKDTLNNSFRSSVKIR